MRGATEAVRAEGEAPLISIHAPRAGSDLGTLRVSPSNDSISIHAPRAGSDRAVDDTGVLAPISIHAPRAGSDANRRILSIWPSNFNPRSPCGERRDRGDPRQYAGNFNPRSPCGERLSTVTPRPGSAKFQSTLPVRGATTTFTGTGRTDIDFNPRSPCGERPL